MKRQILTKLKLAISVAMVAIVSALCSSSSYAQTQCPESVTFLSSPDIAVQETTACSLGVGYLALPASSTSAYSTAVGNLALANNSSGEYNTATGNSALEFNTTGVHNTAAGTDANVYNTTGGDNTASGYAALFSNTIGNGNTVSGAFALTNSTGSGNSAIGAYSCTGVATASNVICIGSGLAGADVSNTTYVAGIYGTALPKGKNPVVCVDSAGQLGTKNCTLSTILAEQGVVEQQQQQIQAQGKKIADLEQRLSQMEALIANK